MNNVKMAIAGAGIFAVGGVIGFLVGRKVTDDEWTRALEEGMEFDQENDDEKVDSRELKKNEDGDRIIVNDGDEGTIFYKPPLDELWKESVKVAKGPWSGFITEDDYKFSQPGFAKRTATWFEVDEVLAGFDEMFEEVDISDFVAPKDVSMMMGFLKSEEVDAVYYRDTAIETDYEIVKSNANWLEEMRAVQGRIADEEGYSE